MMILLTVAVFWVGVMCAAGGGHGSNTEFFGAWMALLSFVAFTFEIVLFLVWTARPPAPWAHLAA
jgi:hypothetical protein